MSGAARKAVAVRFGELGGRSYDYWATFPVAIGDEVLAPGRNGVPIRVTVVEIREDGSDAATSELLGPAPPATAADPA